MSISFSGLASGLDTSSWVESLTALKRAKVTTLQEERETLVLSKNTLNSIKSFFSSFRSTIEKITDTKFNIASMDLFAQNLAVSSKIDKLVATATSEAEEGKYDIKVDRLASNTEALSKYSYTTTIVETTTATENSLLKNLGVKSGDIEINIGGENKLVSITEKETIKSFIEKLKDIGVDAEFNSTTGVFNANIGSNQINDIDNTLIAEKLHLSTSNKGFVSSVLTKEQVENVDVNATLQTSLSDLGVSAGTITINANEYQYQVILEEGDKIQDLISALDQEGITATLENGVFTLKEAYIVDDGTTNLVDAFELTTEGAVNTTQKSEMLTFQTGAMETVLIDATADTKLSNLTTGVNADAGKTVLVENKDGTQTEIVLTEDMSLGELLTEINNAGLTATLKSNGTVSITEGEIVGGTYDIISALGLTKNEGEDSVTQTIETTATLDTTFADLGIYNLNYEVYNSSGELQDSGLSSADGNTTLEEFFNYLTTSAGFSSATIQNGVITIESTQGNYITGDLADALGIGKINSSTESSTLAVTYTQISSVTGEVKFAEISELSEIFNRATATANLSIYDSNNALVDFVNVNGETTLNEFITQLNGKGFNATLEDGYLSIESLNGNYVKGSFAEALGLAGTTTTVVDSVTSSDAVVYQKTIFETTTIGQTLTSTAQIALTGMIDTSSLTALSAVTSAEVVSGTTFKLSTTADLLQLASLVNNEGNSFLGVTLIMSEDIDLSGVDWNPIGYSGSQFKGTFDGNGYDIENLSIDSTSQYTGLFGYIHDATIKNVNLINANVTSTAEYTGALVGWAQNYCTIVNVYTSGSVVGNNHTGGLVGAVWATDAIISSCQVESTVTGNEYAGGVLGGGLGANIIYSSYKGSVSANNYAGGLAGSFSSATDRMSTIALSYANANISLTNSENASIAGGLVGVVSQGSVSISASYFKGNSPGGEIIGAIQGDATVDARCLYHQTDNIIAVESDKLTLNQNCIISATEVPFEYNAKNLATASTTMQELGLTANETIELVSNGTLYTYTVETTTTIGDMLSYLNEKGFNATLDNGILNIEGTEEAWINVDFNNNLDSIFNFEDRRDSYIDVGGNIHLALNGGVKKTLVSTKEIQNVTMDETTTMKDLGISSGTIIIKNTDGSEVASYTYNSSTTMDDYMQFLNDQYFQTGIVDGKLDISSPGDIYVVDENLSNKLNITDSMCIVNYPTASYNTYYTGATLASTTPICVTTGGNVVTKTVAVSLTSTSDIAIHKSTDSFISISKIDPSLLYLYGSMTFKISTTDDLLALANWVNTEEETCAGCTFVLANDIDLSGVDWRPIGNSSTIKFSGIFDGNGYEISGLNINASEENYVGLFGYTDGATIKNLSLTDTNVKGNNYVGALAGIILNATIENVFTSATVEGTTYVGGLIGSSGVGTILISNVRTEGTVTATSKYAGGIVGRAGAASGNVTINDSASNVTLSGTQYLGGIIGGLLAGPFYLNSVYSEGTITSTTSDILAGGILGAINTTLQKVYIDNSYSKMNVVTGGNLIGSVVSGATAEISNTSALSDNYIASGTATLSNCSVIDADAVPFTIQYKKMPTKTSKLGELGLGSDAYITVMSKGTLYTFTATATSTLSDLTDWLINKGFNVSYENNRLSIAGSDINDSEEAYICGELDDKLDKIFNFNDVATTSTINITYAAESTTLDELTQLKFGKDWATFYDETAIDNLVRVSNGSELDFSTLTGDNTIADVFSMLRAEGFTCSIDDGIISIAGDEDLYFENEFEDALDSIFNFNLNTVQVVTTEKPVFTGAQLNAEVTFTINDETTMEDLGVSLATITAVNSSGDTVSLTLDETSTVDDIRDWFTTALGATTSIVDGKFGVQTPSPSYIVSISDELRNALNWDNNPNDVINTSGNLTLNVSETQTIEGDATSYSGIALKEETLAPADTEAEAITESTLLSKLGVSEGEFFVFSNGTRYRETIYTDTTIGSLINTLEEYGLNASFYSNGQDAYIKISGDGNSYLATTNNVNSCSNIVTILFPDDYMQEFDYSSKQLQLQEEQTVTITAEESTRLNVFDITSESLTIKSEGTLSLTLGEENFTITIDTTETFGSLINKLEEIGVNAELKNGQLYLNALSKDLVVNAEGTTSNIVSNLNLVYNADLGGYTESTSVVEQTISHVESIENSVINYADLDTKLEMLNITSGSLSIYRNGEKATISINPAETFRQLQNRIHDSFTDVDIRFNEGYLEIFSNEENVKVEVGSTTDTSNFSAITGMAVSNNAYARSARELYKVNGNSLLVTSGLFKRGDVTEGTFVVGNAVITINDKTTLNSLISRINSSEEANATAYYDTVEGKFVIKSRSTGATFINIEAGTSNFTDIMGLTTSEREVDGTIINTKLNTQAQVLGSNALFQINGTEYSSITNTITSDISRIKGVTLNLKDITNGEVVTVEVKKDYETVSNALSDVVDQYNELMTSIDKELGKDGKLKGQTSLKLLKNQIRSLMINSAGGNDVFKNLSAIGISTEDASANNISTTNLDKLYFDKDKFIDAYKADSIKVKELLVGTESAGGVLSRVETVLEQALGSNYGFFSSAESSYKKQIERMDAKIEKANLAVAKYKARLEQKFQFMDMTISKMQNQFSSFLGT